MVDFQLRENFFQNFLFESFDVYSIGEIKNIESFFEDKGVTFIFVDSILELPESFDLRTLNEYFSYLLQRFNFEFNNVDISDEQIKSIYSYTDPKERINYIIQTLQKPLLKSDVLFYYKNSSQVEKDFIINTLVPYYFLNPWYFPFKRDIFQLFELCEIDLKRIEVLGV